MKISIITVVYNGEKTIRQALRSVISQSYSDIEYIVIDGKSTDNTIKIINEYRDKIDIFISEKDNGLYDALNKGIRLSTGDVIGILHADDRYTDRYAIEEVAKAFKSSNSDSVYSDLIYIKNMSDKILRYWKSGEFNIKKLKFGWMPPHPVFFIKTDIIRRYSLIYDTSLNISGDYDFILKLLGKYKITTHYIPKVLYKMNIGGISNKSISNIIQKSKEDYICIKRNKIGGLFTLFCKNIIKIPQFISHRKIPKLGKLKFKRHYPYLQIG